MSDNTQLSISQAGQRLGLGYRRVRQLIASGELKATADPTARGRRPKWRITPQAVAALQRKRRRRT
jgi:excisionase family DNA binding protein